jgi:hypothetical protein
MGEITPARATELHQRFDIERHYGVSRTRLRNYLKRRRLPADGNRGAQSQVRADDRHAEEPSQKQVEDFRNRQESVAQILKRTFGDLAKREPSLWAHHTYLMLVGLVYDRLASDEAEIPTAELIALSKILAENRRAEARSAEQGQPETPENRLPSGEDELPENFADIVRRVYGTNFQTAETARGQSDSSVSSAG